MILIPNLDFRKIGRVNTLLLTHPQNIVGSFWVMQGTLYDSYDETAQATHGLPNWWIDITLSSNSARGILEAIENGYFKDKRDSPLYHGYCILIIANTSSPADFTYLIENVYMEKSVVGGFLKLMAEHQIKAHTEITTPSDFIDERYGCDSTQYRNIERWTTQIWEDYCSYLLTRHGRQMVSSYWRNVKYPNNLV